MMILWYEDIYCVNCVIIPLFLTRNENVMRQIGSNLKPKRGKERERERVGFWN